jgi:hypothetical protein
MANAYLKLFLKRAGVMTGPLRSPTRHSDLSRVKESLINGKIFAVGYQAYNNFGSALHYRFLLGKRGKFKLTPMEEKQIQGMLRSLNAHPIVKRLMAECTVREKRRSVILFGVRMRYTPDAHGLRRPIKILDAKTTACNTLKDFEESAKQYGYFRQGDTYSLALKASEFWDIGISKSPPYKVFPVLIQNDKEFMRYVREELKFLLYIFKHYGNPVIHGKAKRKKH